MPIHDWTRVGDGDFHAFHTFWIVLLNQALNAGLLPPGYYALPEQRVVGREADVLTLEVPGGAGPVAEPDAEGGVAVLAPPLAAVRVEPRTRPRRRVVAVRTVAGRRLVAVIEIVSPGNKSSRDAARDFVRMAAEVLSAGVHLLVIDLLPHGPRDPEGLPNAICRELAEDAAALPTDKPLTFASFESAEGAVTAYAAIASVGEPLPAMPLFLVPGRHVMVPLEASYTAAFESIPAPVRAPLEVANPPA